MDLVNTDGKVTVEQLKNICDPGDFDFENTEELAPLMGIIGQHRAKRSFDIGFKIKTQGFNLFVSGVTGTSKLSAVRDYITPIAAKETVPSDWCYVYNFRQKDRPLAIELAPGRGKIFVEELEELIHDVKTEIPKAFEEEEYEKRKSEILKNFHNERDKILEELTSQAAEKGFAVELTPAGVVTVPIVKGRPMNRIEYEKLPDGQKKTMQEMTEEVQAETKLYLAKIRALEKETKQKVKKLDQEIALFAVGHLLDDLRKKHEDDEKILGWLNDVQDDIIKNLETFKEEKKEGLLPGFEFMSRKPSFEQYKVNLVVNNSESKGAPVIIESNPSYYNLFGKLEYSAQFGAMSTSFQMIKAGAFHRANGGYIILNSLDVLLNLLSWDAIKRSIKTKELRIENIGEHFQAIPAATLRPEPVPLDVKVVLIGNPFIYHLLYKFDEDFQKLFKIKADFDIQIDRNKEHVRQYALLVAQKCKESGLKHFDKNAVAKIVDHSSRVVENQKKLSTKLMEIEDLISEASFWASQNGNKYVTAEDVDSAIEEKIYRSSMIEEKIQEYIEDGTLMIDVERGKIGQVNGIAVNMIGDYMFGKPSRITAQTFVGRKGVINIERETKMSGRIHNKGVMILGGYIGGKYAFDKPISMSASLTFEQLYDEIEGDSASSSELYCILSSLAGLPINQGIAVTGSVNQKGEVQAIGAVNQKIEGFFDVCKAKKLTGSQGVVIPFSNVKNLMLKQKVIDAVKDGMFHIWAVKTIDEGISILTGVNAGKLIDEKYEDGSVNYLVDKKLTDLAERLKKFVPEEAKKAA